MSATDRIDEPDVEPDCHSWTFEGSRIWYRRAGEGEPILFLHNGGASHELWDRQFEHFRSTHDVITPDALGFGRSDRPNVPYTLDLYVRMVTAFIDELRLAPVSIVGNCIGSATALSYGFQHPDRVRALVLVNTLTQETARHGDLRLIALLAYLPPAVRNTIARFLARHPLLLDRQLRNQFGQYVDADYLTRLHDFYRDPANLEALWNLCRNGKTFIRPTPSGPGRPPICFVWGGMNRTLPLPAGRQLAAAIHPDEMHVLNQCAHALPRECPDELNSIIETFLAQHASRTVAET